MSTTIPTTQTAVQATKYGNPAEVLTINTSAAVPTVKDNEVLINVQAVSVNPLDNKIIKGDLALIISPKFPYTIGVDLSGVVVAVGKKAQRLKVGDAVYAMAPMYGAFAEYVALPEQQVSLKPASLSHTEAASLPAAALTAIQVLKRHGSFQAGQKVLALGGSGGVGTVAIQLAKALGASEITTTTSSKNVEFVKSLGAGRVIAYDKQQWQTELAGADYSLILDCVGGKDAYNWSHQVLKKGGVFATTVGDDSGKVTILAALTLASNLIRRKVASFFYGVNYVWVQCDFASQQAREELDEVARLVKVGQVKPVIEQTYTLKDVVHALNTSAAGRVRGKLVVDFAAQK